ncbi:MAG: LuxR C-terminal-related transcriptional regulator [Alloalcanivorax venustensis]|uniref:LuxR C-terminal-related transcriptional regulator n=1 Tax=Alloalcanivorax venustensis TaxID=172371 RepID=UPI0030036FC4
MAAQEGLLSFIGDIYEASYRPEHWGPALTRLCQLLNAKSGGIYVEDHAEGTRYMLANHGLPKLAGATYRLGLGKYDPIYQIQASRPVAEAAQVAQHADQKIENPLYYRLMMKPNDVGYVAAISLFNDKEWHAGIGIHRSFQAEPFSDRELQLLDVLAPHFQRALRIQKALHQAKHRAASLQSVLSELMHGVLVLNRQHRITYQNAVSKRILAQHSALWLDGDRLRTHYAQDAARLWAAVSGLRRNDLRQQAVGLHHPDRTHPLILVATLRDGFSEPLSELYGDGETVLYVSDPGSPFHASEDDLASLFDFTRAEAGIAIALVNGLSLQEIAARNQVGKETVRSQLKSIFCKLGVSKQQDVVRLLLNSGLNREARFTLP